MSSIVHSERANIYSQSESICNMPNAYKLQNNTSNLIDDLLLLNVLNKNILTTIVEDQMSVAFDYCQMSKNYSDLQDHSSLIELKRRIAYLESQNNILVLKNKSLIPK